MNAESEVILKIKKLSLDFHLHDENLNILDGISIDIHNEEILAVLGESGSGKSSLAKSILNLHREEKSSLSGEIIYKNNNLLKLNDTELENIRGRNISYIFQDPHSHLNPLLSVGYQINETIVKHKIASRKSSKELTYQILSDVGLKSPRQIYNMYPFQLSGGMKQRVLIAIAICCKPQIIIADEPTTSLDSNIQKIIVDLLMHLCKKYSISIIWITHNINLAKYVANNIAIMYGGKIVEYGNKNDISSNPKHPYTKDLLKISDLKDYQNESKLKFIGGSPFNFSTRKETCVYLDRCSKKIDSCNNSKIEYIEKNNHKYMCIHE
jgi:peptide/nickel transport system ATP-binding protein